MSFISDIMQTPMEIVEDLFKRGFLPIIILGIIAALIWFVFFK